MQYPSLSLDILDETIDISPPEYRDPLTDVGLLIKGKVPMYEVSFAFAPVLGVLERELSSITSGEFNEYCSKIEKTTELEFKPEEGLRIQGNSWSIAEQRYPDFIKTDVLFYILNHLPYYFPQLPSDTIVGNYCSLTDQTFLMKSFPIMFQRNISIEEAAHALIDRERGFTRKMVDYSKKSGIIQHIGEIEASLFHHDPESEEFEKAADRLKETYPHAVMAFLLGSLDMGIKTSNEKVKKAIERVGIDLKTYNESIEFASQDAYLDLTTEELAKAISIKTLRKSDKFHDRVMALWESVIKNREDLNFERVVTLVESENSIRDEIMGLPKRFS